MTPLLLTSCRKSIANLPQDAKLAKVDNMDEDDLDKLREKRRAQLIAAQKIKQVV